MLFMTNHNDPLQTIGIVQDVMSPDYRPKQRRLTGASHGDYMYENGMGKTWNPSTKEEITRSTCTLIEHYNVNSLQLAMARRYRKTGGL